MRPPYRLVHATSGSDNLLITGGATGSLTGVEVRTPALSLGAVARIGAARGELAATGWDERFDQVDGVLNLPPGHRLLAALGADSAPGAWVEQWGLLDLFLLLLAAVVAFRVFGWIWAAVAFLGIALMHQEEHTLVWLILCVLLSSALLRVASAGRPKRALKAVRYGLLGVLLLALVPFSISQLRFALYPQLAASGDFESAPPAAKKEMREVDALYARAPAAGPPAANYLQAPMQTNAPPPMKQSALRSSIAEETYAPDTLLQAGPGVPRWRYVAYSFGWSGPVESAQTVRFIVLRPGWVSIWRVLGVALLALLFARLARGSLDPNRPGEDGSRGGRCRFLLSVWRACSRARRAAPRARPILNCSMN